MKPKQPELTKVEILMLSTLGEICSKLEDILKGSRRKFELNACEFISEDVNLLWRAPESYNQCYIKFGYENRDDLKTYVSQFCERLEVNDAWESLEDIEAYWNDFVLTVSKKLNLNECHDDNFIKYYFNNTKQLFNVNSNEIASYSTVFPRLSLVILMPIYIPGFILSNLLKDLDNLKKEIYVFGVDTNIILFGSIKKAKLWLKQYKVNFENIFVDSSDEILKARRNLNNIFSIKSMETIGLSSKTKTKFLIPDDVDWQKYLFPGGLALVNSDGTVHYEHLSSFIGDFPSGEEIIEKIMLSFGDLNDLSREESVKYLKDGMKYYIAPKFDRFQYEKHSGFYYDPETTLYYEARSGYFFDGDRAIYLFWCDDSKCYLPVPTPSAENPSIATLNTSSRAIYQSPSSSVTTEIGLDITKIDYTHETVKSDSCVMSGSRVLLLEPINTNPLESDATDSSIKPEEYNVLESTVAVSSNEVKIESIEPVPIRIDTVVEDKIVDSSIQFIKEDSGPVDIELHSKRSLNCDYNLSPSIDPSIPSLLSIDEFLESIKAESSLTVTNDNSSSPKDRICEDEPQNKRRKK